MLDRRWRGVRAVSKKTALPTNQPTNQPTNYYQQHWFYRTWLTPVQLNFEKHVSAICKKTNNQLNAISRIGVVLKQKEKEIWKNSFVYSNFIYGPLIWYFTTRKGIEKIQKVQERSIIFILNDYDKKLHFQLLDISKKPSMEVKRLRILITEIFKTLNDSNLVFMKDIFHYCQNKSHKKHNLHVHSRNTWRYGNSVRVVGAYIWNSLPENIKSTDSFYELKNFLKGWYGCKCHPCIV